MAAARSLVPADAEVVSDTEVIGSHLAGVDYSASVEYRGGAADDTQLLATVQQTAASRSWKEVDRNDAPGAFTVAYGRRGIRAYVQVLRDRGHVGGEVDARRMSFAQSDRRGMAVAVGVLVAVGAGLALGLRRTRRTQLRRSARA